MKDSKLVKAIQEAIIVLELECMDAEYQALSSSLEEALHETNVSGLYPLKITEEEHFVSATTHGEVCFHCAGPATHKVGEEIASDDPYPMRHNLTMYVCCQVFTDLMGRITTCPVTLSRPCFDCLSQAKHRASIQGGTHERRRDS